MNGSKAGNTSFPVFLRRWFWPFLALAVIWSLFFQELSDEWRLNAQYSYGYMVPLLGLALFLRRWPGRPSAAPGRADLACLAAGFLLVLLPLIRLCAQANPEWRLLYWLHGCVAVGLSLCLLYFFGGQRWLLFFAPPVFFMLIAVPWPAPLEQWLIQGLMRLTAALTVECAGWFGIPAVQHGNVIETTVGMVGIDEACSGVRSLQSALMLSLFLGEMYRFAVGKRVVLLAASLMFDLLANLARTSFLVWAAANKGLAQMEAWHDTAGILVMVIVLPGLLGLARVLKSRKDSMRSEATTPPGILRSLPNWVGIATLLWIALGEAGSELWYRVHETKLVPTAHWSAVWPNHSPHFKATTVPPNALSILRCSDSQAAEWEDATGYQWSGFLLRWKPGKNSAQLAKGHRPEICFPAAGARLLEDYGQLTVPISDFQMPFRHQSFEIGNRTVYVFYCLWPDRTSLSERPLLEDGSQRSRLEAVLAGKRHLGQQVLELVLSGPDSATEAANTLREELPALIRPMSPN